MRSSAKAAAKNYKEQSEGDKMKETYNEIIQINSVIPTTRMVLRKFTSADVEDVYEYASDQQTVRYLTWAGISDLEAARKVITDFYCSDGIYAIEIKENKKCIGCIDVRIHPEHEKASFGYVLNRNYWNHGYMSEALEAILRLCFEELELNRVEATHYVGNEGSGKVMEKCGMRQEGIALQEVKIKGVFQDVVHYGITKEQYYMTPNKNL
jgi:ribosomal-protein-alanine N-acetyltransferase